MYSPTTRLLTILELLQSHRQLSGSQLASRLEISPRSIRRYIVMLQDMGIPIEAERGPDGAYYLGRGVKLPPLMITNQEASALVLGLLVLQAFHFPVELVAIEGSLAKLERVMPAALLEQVRALQAALSFNVVATPTALQPSIIARLSLAVHKSQSLNMRYIALNGTESTRLFDPYGIVYYQGFWYAVGYCHTRRDLRTFRLDRISELQATEQSFVQPVGFDPVQHVHNAFATMPGQYPIEIVLETSMINVQQALPPAAGSFEATDAGIIWRREVADLWPTALLLLKFDFPVSIRQPPELRAIMQQLAAKALHLSKE
ncbi:helix-turn-helix transcriptional regulator [Herpetosiphon llansteffanensis]|uniref:helix-turn-helix transcriptional regulator n=1 Tax=Herpetosiphon llansteffanensis TaxID=2094568 RepID=UPI000D7CCB9F|nr:YafY family protein [Herpetosiphon llansteffanensis]